MRWTIAICALIGLAALQDASPRIHKRGILEIRADFAGDFHEGRLGIGGQWYDVDSGDSIVVLDYGANELPLPRSGSFKGSDFWFESGKQKFLRPQHGAKFSKMPRNSSGYEACAKTTYSGNSLRVDKLASGTHVCMRTSEGRFTDITIHGYDLGTFRFTVAYVTWEK
jgi:hypothetical protein